MFPLVTHRGSPLRTDRFCNRLLRDLLTCGECSRCFSTPTPTPRAVRLYPDAGHALAGGGTALATGVTGSHAARPAAAHATTAKTTDKGNVTTVPYVKPFDLKGMNLALAKEALAQAGLKVGTVTHGAIDNCKPGSVIAVSPLSPTILHGGEKVDLTLCG